MHERSFYGYNVFLVVDAASELPVTIVMATVNKNDTLAFEPLIEEFDERYDTENLQAALADAGFDSQDNREVCQDCLNCPLLTPINLHRPSSLLHIRDDIKQLFKKRENKFVCSPHHAGSSSAAKENKIDIVQDELRRVLRGETLHNVVDKEVYQYRK